MSHRLTPTAGEGPLKLCGEGPLKEVARLEAELHTNFLNLYLFRMISRFTIIKYIENW